MLSKYVFVGIIFAVVLRRLFELRISRNNEANILGRGGKKHSDNLLGAVKVLQVSWLIAAITEVWYFDRPFSFTLASVALLATLAGQVLCYLSMQSLGQRWTLPIMTLPDTPVVDKGIYLYLRHPNWLGVILEIAALPLIHGAYLTSIIFSVINALLMSQWIKTEEKALAKNSNYTFVFANRPRFVPKLPFFFQATLLTFIMINVGTTGIDLLVPSSVDAKSNSELPSSSELSVTLTNTLRSAFSDNLPDTVRTFLNSFLTSQNKPNLFVSNSTLQDIGPLFYSENPDNNFPNLVSTFFDFLTPSSEPDIVVADDKNVKSIWGRGGNDNLFGFDPSVDHLGKQKIDVFTGSLTDEQLSGTSLSASASIQWKNRFILGDWQKLYYVENQPSTLGLNQFALITDFKTNQDIIQLHGTSKHYQLADTSLGTAIFWQDKNGFDLVGLVAGVSSSSLSLEGDDFKFVGNTQLARPALPQAKQIGSTGIDFLFDSSVDAKGNVYVGGGTGGSLAQANLGSRDGWLVKNDSHGNQQWIKQFGTPEFDGLWAMSSDGSNIYVSGQTAGVLGNTSKGGKDVFLAKYDSNSNQQWIRQFGTVTFEESFSNAADTIGNIYVGGHTVGDLAGPNRSKEQGGSAYPSTDSFVTKYDSNGNQVWTQQFGTPLLDDNWGTSIDKDGNVFAGGNTRGDFGGKNAGFYDAYLVKLDQYDGHLNWVRQFGSSDYDFLWGIKNDSKGNVYATGWTLGDLSGKNAGFHDIWLAKYDNNGNQQWITQFGTSGDDQPVLHGIVIDSNDNIFLTGNTDSNLGGKNAGSYDAWVGKYDKDGKQLWIKEFGTPEYDTSSTISTDTYGNLYVGGVTEGSLGDINAGSYDSWVVKLDADKGTIKDFSGNSKRRIISAPK